LPRLRIVTGAKSAAFKPTLKICRNPEEDGKKKDTVRPEVLQQQSDGGLPFSEETSVNIVQPL